MVMIRSLTPEEIERVSNHQHGYGRKRTPQYIAISNMAPGDGILLSHQGLSCGLYTSDNTHCGFNNMLTRLRKISPYSYQCIHSNGGGSDVMVVCFAKPVPPTEGGQE